MYLVPLLSSTNCIMKRAIQQGLQGRAILYNVITSTSEELGIYPEITKNILLSMVAPVEDRYHSAAEARIALQGMFRTNSPLVRINLIYRSFGWVMIPL